MCIISSNLAEEDTVYSVLLIISMIVEFSKHPYKHICICNKGFGIYNPNTNIFEFT
jgi:muramidase (phage lysozyme)